jgi:hypothetical protein
MADQNRDPGAAADRDGRQDSRHFASSLIRFTLLACVAATAGCSKGLTLLEVTGHVTVHHQPLEQGIIRFQPADGKGPAAEAVVTAGQYKMPTTAGHKKVSIQGFKKVGQVPIGGPGGPMTDKMEQILPPSVSDPNRTELACDVESGAKPLDFDVEATPTP